MKIKVISILLISIFSFILWGAISLNEDYYMGITMPIKFVQVSDSTAVSNVSEDEVKLNIKGQGWQLAKLILTDELKFAIRVGKRYGKQEVILKSELENNSWFSSNLQIIEINPDKISFFIEHAAKKQVKIVPNIKITFEEGFTQGDSIQLSNDSITVYGPISELSKLKEVKTKFYEFSNLNKKITEEVELEPIKLVGYSLNKVLLTLDVQKIVDKTFEEIPIETLEVPVNYELQLVPNKINIKVRGGINTLSKIKNEEIKIFVKFNDAFKDTLGYLVPQVTLPPYTQQIELEPPKVEYIIKQR